MYQLLQYKMRNLSKTLTNLIELLCFFKYKKEKFYHGVMYTVCLIFSF